jgi:hypothetical protein
LAGILADCLCAPGARQLAIHVASWTDPVLSRNKPLTLTSASRIVRAVGAGALLLFIRMSGCLQGAPAEQLPAAKSARAAEREESSRGEA